MNKPSKILLIANGEQFSPAFCFFFFNKIVAVTVNDSVVDMDVVLLVVTVRNFSLRTRRPVSSNKKLFSVVPSSHLSKSFRIAQILLNDFNTFTNGHIEELIFVVVLKCVTPGILFLVSEQYNIFS